MNLRYQQARRGRSSNRSDQINKSIDILRQQLALQQQSRRDHARAESRRSTTPSSTTNDLRDNIANFDDFFRPLRNYFYWEPHCFDIPLVRGAAVGVRLARRHRRAHATSSASVIGEPRQARCAAAATGGADPAADRDAGDQPRSDADELRHHVGHLRRRPRRRWRTRPQLGAAFDARRTTTPSTCRRRRSTTPTSSAASSCSCRPTARPRG